MTTLVTADLHLSENPRDAYRFQFLEKTLLTLVREHEVTRVIVAGDLTEVKDSHRAPFVNRIVDGFAALAKHVDVYILKGNHDYAAEDVPFYRFLRHLDRVHWINEPTAIKLRGLGDCLFLPHTRHMEEDWVDWMFDARDWFFCHQTFKGSDLGHGYKAEGVATPFTKGAKVISGDVHVPQKVGPVTYVGSPTSIDFGDDFEPRVLILDGDKMRSVPVPGPQKVLLEVEWPLSKTKLAAPSAVFSVAADVGAGDVVKVKVHLPPDCPTSRAEVRAAAQSWACDAEVELYAVQIVAPEAGRDEKVGVEKRHQTDDQLVKAYAKKMGKDDKVTLAAGIKIVEETP